MAEEYENAMVVDEDAGEEAEEAQARDGADALRLIERYIAALENGAVEYGGKWGAVWWEDNPRPGPYEPVADAWARDIHGEKLRLGEEFAETGAGFYGCDWEFEEEIRRRAFGFCNVAEPGKPTRPWVVSFGEMHIEDCGGCVFGIDADTVWMHEVELDDEERYRGDAERLDELESAVRADNEIWSDSVCLGPSFGFWAPFIPNEDTCERLDVDGDTVRGIIAYGGEQRSGIEKLIDLLERWLKIRRRALDEGKPIPLAAELPVWRWVDPEPLIDRYDMYSPEELSAREQMAVSLYIEKPYQPEWNDGRYSRSSRLPREVEQEIGRRLNPPSSAVWSWLEEPDSAVLAKRRVDAAPREIKRGIDVLKETLSSIDQNIELLGADVQKGLCYSVYRSLIERGIEGLEKAFAKAGGARIVGDEELDQGIPPLPPIC